jgi:hypothetical protein
MDDRYLNGIIGCQAVVCGRRLTNLTPWHVTILNAIDSPVVSGHAEVKAEDMLLFISVMKSQWPEIPELKPRLRDVYWLIRMRKKSVFLRNFKTLNVWMESQVSSPRLWVDDGDNSAGKQLSSPTMLALVIALVSKVNVTLSEAWNMRLSEARWYDTCKAELEGADLKIAYDNDDEFHSSIDGKSESEIIAIAKEQLGKEQFKKWHKARKKNDK